MFDSVGMDRRALMARALLLVGASVAPASIDAFAATKARPGKRFLNPAQFTLLSAVADTILPTTDTPGALAAGIPAKLDGMLSTWASAKTRLELIQALDRIDAASKSQKRLGFAALSVADRAAVLRPYDAAALKPAPAPANAPKVTLFAPATYVADNGYLRLKDLVITLYYSSEIAMTKELIYEHVPGTWQPSIKTTEATRPWASAGPF